MTKNSIGREIPESYASDYGLYEGQFSQIHEYRRAAAKVRPRRPDESKLVDSIHEAIVRTGLESGMTISFHHHFREGDYVMNMVMEEIARMGIRDLTIAPSSIANVHEPLIDYIKQGVVTGITASGLRDKLGAAVSHGIMDNPVVIRSHGGRARAIVSGDLHIDVAFIGAPSCDEYGNINGTRGNATCGSLGYAQMDARYADQVVAITDALVPYPNMPISIPQTDVDYVVCVDAIGDPDGIAKGATRLTKNPKELLIAEYAAKVIASTNYFKDGFSFQTGTGGASLAVTRFLRPMMQERGIKAGFVLGGITNAMVEMLDAGQVGRILDVQDFDHPSAVSLAQNDHHYEIDAEMYASPLSKGNVVNRLDVAILSALEVDTDFNVNVLTGSDGVIRGASGGHSDTAASCRMSMIVAPLVRGRIPTVVDQVTTVVTPGESVDVVVTEYGVAVNPQREDLKAMLDGLDVPLFDIRSLRDKAYAITGAPRPIRFADRTVALVEYRDGSLIDAVHQV